jgi:hypothetical protein
MFFPPLRSTESRGRENIWLRSEYQGIGFADLSAWGLAVCEWQRGTGTEKARPRDRSVAIPKECF